MDLVIDTATYLGWPAAAIHQESFGDHTRGDTFLAVLSRSHLEIEVGETQSLLEAIESAGVEAPYLCRGGACGQCMTRVLAGKPDHRDHVLSPEEHASGEVIMICVSRSKTPRLVLDI
jgi:ferredoxin